MGFWKSVAVLEGGWTAVAEIGRRAALGAILDGETSQLSRLEQNVEVTGATEE